MTDRSAPRQGRLRLFDVTRVPGFGAIAIATFVILYLPILLLVAYSFNAGQSLASWEGLSWQWYASAAQNTQVQEAAMRSLVLALVSATLATTVATMAALGTTRRGKVPGQTVIYLLINQPLMVPEIVTAVALLIFFAMIKVVTGYTGMIYLILAHTAFCIPFAYLPIRARLESMDLTLEAAAADLYASPWQAFCRITLPLMWPGIIAGLMLAFVISLDDVVITEFVKSAGQDTLPTYMLGQMRRVVTPEVNAIASVLLVISVIFVSLFFALTGNKNKE